VHLNQFASSVGALDMSTTDEFKSLLESASDLGIAHDPSIRYVSRNVIARHLRFNVLEWGREDAPAIMCLHGGHQSAHSWDLVSLSLASRFRVITPDQRGHGDSEWVRSGHYTNAEMAADALALMDALALDRPLLMGHSMGGRNTLMAALSAPERMRALVVVDIGPEVSDKGRRSIASFVAANEEFEDLDAFIANVRRYDPYRSLEHIERTVRYNLFQRADGKYVSKCDRLPRKLGLTQQFSADELSLEHMAALAMPVLVVRGANSTILEESAAERFTQALPDGALKIVPACGHNVHSQNTLGFLDAIDGFLSQHVNC
jgi:esterase